MRVNLPSHTKLGTVLATNCFDAFALSVDQLLQIFLDLKDIRDVPIDNNTSNDFKQLQEELLVTFELLQDQSLFLQPVLHC